VALESAEDAFEATGRTDGYLLYFGERSIGFMLRTILPTGIRENLSSDQVLVRSRWSKVWFSSSEISNPQLSN
jgi:hypothetical protein